MTRVTNKSIEYIDTINPITAHRLPDKKANAEFQTSSTAVPLKSPPNNAAFHSLLTTCICIPYLKVQGCVSGTEMTMTWRIKGPHATVKMFIKKFLGCFATEGMSSMLATVLQRWCIKDNWKKNLLSSVSSRVESGFLKLLLKFRARREITRIITFFNTIRPSRITLKKRLKNSIYFKTHIYFHLHSINYCWIIYISVINT